LSMNTFLLFQRISSNLFNGWSFSQNGWNRSFAIRIDKIQFVVLAAFPTPSTQQLIIIIIMQMIFYCNCMISLNLFFKSRFYCRHCVNNVNSFWIFRVHSLKIFRIYWDFSISEEGIIGNLSMWFKLSCFCNWFRG
jgi:hypothetical protein